MKIVDLKCHRIEIPFSEEFQPAHSTKPWNSFKEYLVEIFTDEEITGIGASWFSGFIPNWEKYLETTVKQLLTHVL